MNDRINSIQYMRAVAALLVVLFHAVKRVGEAFGESVASWFEFGAGGVDIFFVISGFIMWTIAVRRPVGPAEFILRRVARVGPVFWVAICAWTAMAVVGLTPWVQVSVSHVVQSLLFIPHYNPSYDGEIWPILVPGWTLNYEMFFYALFALALFVPASMRFPALLLALGGLVAAGLVIATRSPILLTYTSPLLLEFAAGIVLGQLWTRGAIPSGKVALGLLAGGTALMLAAPLFGDPTGASRILLLGIPAVLIVTGALGTPWLAGEQPFPLLVGNASYSLYLTHIFVLTVMAVVASRLPSGIADSVVFGVGFVAVGVAASIAVGILTYRLIEGPLEGAFRSLLGIGKRRIASGHEADLAAPSV